MAYKVVLGKSARRDIEAILDWYAGESPLALEKFIVGLYNRISELSQAPEQFSLVKQRPRFRKVKIKRYPYYIVYRFDEAKSLIFISAMIHERRNPDLWVKGLR